MPAGGDTAADDYYDQIEDNILDSLIIVGLAAALAFLVYYRQQRQTNHRREVETQQQGQGPGQGQQGNNQNLPPLQPNENAIPPAGEQQPLPGQQADGGFFPPPEDPNYAAWVAGGVGH